MATPNIYPYGKLITTAKYLRKVKLFWKRRVDIQLSQVNALNALQSDFNMPSFDGSLGRAMEWSKEMLRQEVEYQKVVEVRLRSAYEAIERLYSNENSAYPDQCYLVQHAQALKLRSEELTRQKEELSRIEGEADAAARLSYQTDSPPPCTGSPSSPRFDFSRLLSRRRRASSTSSAIESFHHADMKYRDACAKYNLKRYEILNEAERAVQASVHFHYDFLEAVKGIIIAFANAQADFAQVLNFQFLNTSPGQPTPKAIKPYRDSERFRVELRSGISGQIGLPHQYKNYEFSLWRPPIILFVHAFRVLAEHTRSLSTPPRNDESETILRRVVHDLETHWDPMQVSGGPEITSILTSQRTEVSSGDLLIHFLRRLPEPLIPMQEPDRHSSSWEPDAWDGRKLTRLTSTCNRPWAGSCRRRMLVTLGRLLTELNDGDPRTWWTWWNTEDRAGYWSELLTRRGDAIAHLLPWWLFSITLKGTSIEIEDVKINALRLI